MTDFVNSLLSALERRFLEEGKAAAEMSLHTFFRDYAWPIIEPKRKFYDNWHLEAISEHLEALTRRDITRLLINVPFRTSKSTLVSVAWPAWVWLRDPGHQWLCGSYAEKLAIRDNLKMRRLVTHPTFQQLWGDRFVLTSDQNQKVRYQNDRNGYRIAFGMTGGVMGDGGDTLLIDDPHDRQGAHSEAERETALTTYDEALVTRLNDPATGGIVIIMQRLHRQDLSGHVLEEKGWEHLMLPMRFEKERRCVTSLGFRDPRKEEGELLWPERFPEATVKKLEGVLREYGTAGQLQQRPAPAGGGILKTASVQLWPANKDLPDIHYIVSSYDTAYTEQTANDPAACTVWGVFYRGETACVLLLEAWSEFMAYPDLKRRMMADTKAEYGGVANNPVHPPRKSDLSLIEDKGSGISLIQEMRRANLQVRAYNPGKASKVQRAHMVSDIIDAGIVYVLESKREPGKPVMWARPLLTQMEEFPNAEHDDYVDTFTQMGIYLKHAEFLKVPELEDDPIEELDYEARRKAKTNPYAV